MLPDDVLLAIFDFYVKEDQFTKRGIEAWQSLVHVCQRWRSLVFGSPRYLNLQLVCTPGTQRGMLDVWPALPLVFEGCVSRPEVDNVIAMLEHNDRMCRIGLRYDSSSQMEKVWAAMQEPFPELAHLQLRCDNTDQVVPDFFLGGSAPRLRFLQLDAVPFPGLPKLLLSTTHLVSLHLSDIPHSGYFSPEALVTALSLITNLNKLSLGFRSLLSRPDPKSRHSLPSTRTVLPALTHFDTEVASEYLEDFVARVDVPRLNELRITLFNQIDIDTPQLVQFMSRTPTLKMHDEAHVTIGPCTVNVTLLSRTDPGLLTVHILFGESDFQLSSLVRVSTSSLPCLSTVESLYIYEEYGLQSDWEDEIRIENTEWLDLLRPYTAAENLYLSEEFVPGVMRALKDSESVGGRRTVLPILQTLSLEGFYQYLPGPAKGDIWQFVTTRRFSGYFFTVSFWDGTGRF